MSAWGKVMETDTMLDKAREIQEALKPLDYAVVGFDVPPQEPLIIKLVKVPPQSDGRTQ